MLYENEAPRIHYLMKGADCYTGLQEVGVVSCHLLVQLSLVWVAGPSRGDREGGAQRWVFDIVVLVKGVLPLLVEVHSSLEVVAAVVQVRTPGLVLAFVD
jgi:hypothetical protein